MKEEGLHMRRRLIGTAAVAILVLGIADPARAAITKVIDTRVHEYGFVIDNDGVRTVRAWSADTAQHPNRYALWVKVDTGAPRKITGNGSWADIGGIDLGGPHGDLISYDIFRPHARSYDIGLYDVVTRHAVHAADGANTLQNEFHPTISGEWLLFGKTPLRAVSNCSLYKLDGSDTRPLFVAASRNFVQADQVNGDYAVYTECDATECSVHRYTISTDTDVTLPNAGRAAYYASVTSTGVVYYVIGSPTRCGVGTSIRKWTGGSAPSITTLPNGVDVTQSMWAYERPAGGVTVYFTRVVCGGMFRSGIYSTPG